MSDKKSEPIEKRPKATKRKFYDTGPNYRLVERPGFAMENLDLLASDTGQLLSPPGKDFRIIPSHRVSCSTRRLGVPRWIWNYFITTGWSPIE